MRDILDLGRFPLDDPDGSAGQALVARCRGDLARWGYFDLDGLVRQPALSRAVDEVAPALDSAGVARRRRHTIYPGGAPEGVPPGHPALAELETVNETVCADRIEGTLVLAIYEYPALRAFLARVIGVAQLHLMADPLARVTVTRYLPGEELNWHFDSTEITATLVLQAPQFGGEFEYARDLRSDSDPNPDGVAELLAGGGRVEAERLVPGTLNVFRGRNSAHRVTPVGGPRPRITAVFAYCDRPGVTLSEAERLELFGRAS